MHEFAEQIGLGHRSEGTKGHDRRMILKKERIICDPVVATVAVLANEDVTVSPVQAVVTRKEDQAPSFSALSLDDNSDDDKTSSDQGMSVINTDDTTSRQSVGPISNSLLANLATERAERQKEGNHVPAKSTTTKKKEPKGRPLGGARRPVPKTDEDDTDALDDMAFLEAQIKKSQNAHGRKVVGSGKGYRTIVNGVLNSRPESKSAPTNTAAMSALQSKLKQAQHDRKTKAPKKK